MTRIRGALLAAGVVLFTTPAAGQIVGRPFEVSGHAGYFKSDDRARRQDAPEFGGALGWRLHPWLTIEGQALFAPSKADSAPAQKYNFSYAGLDLRFNLVPPENRVVPFVMAGGGYGLSHTTGTEPEKQERGAGSLGVGALWNFFNQRTHLRMQARYTFFRERGLPEFSGHPSISLGIQYNFGGKEKDVDLDGVRDWIDRCPATPFGATVDAHGCPIDSDGDGVFDGLDQCPGTIPGCVVDSVGCAVDSDGDGVCDGLDQCPDTPIGAEVDSLGCPADTDGDGVLFGIDQCPDTPQGCLVDSVGCTIDTDGDGVCDGLDQCPATPAGTAVNETGCPYRISLIERQLIGTGVYRIQDVGFASARGDLEANVLPTLDTLGTIFPQYPDVRFEAIGFTDFRGDSAAAFRMSLARGRAIQNHLVREHRISTEQLGSRGGGPAGQGAEARYVEIRVINREALVGELEKRVPPAAPAPPDTSGTGTEP